MLVKSLEQHTVNFPRWFKQYFLYHDSLRIWRIAHLADWKCSLSEINSSIILLGLSTAEFGRQLQWALSSSTKRLEFTLENSSHVTVLLLFPHKRPIRLKFHVLAPSSRSPILPGYIDILRYVTPSHAHLRLLCPWSSQFSNQKLARFNTTFKFYRWKSPILMKVLHGSPVFPFGVPGLTDHPGLWWMIRIQSLTKTCQK